VQQAADGADRTAGSATQSANTAEDLAKQAIATAGKFGQDAEAGEAEDQTGEQAIAAVLGKLKKDAEAGRDKVADARGEAALATTVGEAQAAAIKARQGAEAAAAAAAKALRTAAAGVPVGSAADIAATGSEGQGARR